MLRTYHILGSTGGTGEIAMNKKVETKPLKIESSAKCL
jgi:hypothetical protein